MGDTENLILSWRTTMMAMVCLPILVCVVLLFCKKAERSASQYLALFLFLAVVAVMPQIIGFAGFYQVWPGLTFFPFATDLWLGPLFYLHTYRLIKGQGPKWQKLLLLPGIAQTSYYTWAYLFLGDYKQKWAFNDSFHEPYIVPIESILAAGLLLFALISVWRMNRQYKPYLQNTQSAAAEFEPVWIERIVLALVLGGALYIGIEVLTLLFDFGYQAAFPFQVLLMATLAWLSVEAVWRLAVTFPKITDIPEQASDNSPELEEAKDWFAEANKIKHKVEHDNWYLEPRFSLRELTKRLGSNEACVSRSINQGLGVTFNEFINGLRVSHAQQLIQSTDMPMLTIALDSGFNSKATFNRVFRDIAELTPTQFKKNNSQKSLKT